MRSLTKFQIPVGAAFATLLLMLTAPLHAETWRMATKQPVDSPEGKVFQMFADLASEYSDGNLTVQIFPNEQLGSEDAVLEQLQSHVIQIYAEGLGFLKKWAPDTTWANAAFMFEDRDHWVRFMNSDLAHNWWRQLEAEAGITVLGDPTLILRGPYRVMVSQKDVESLDDIAGIKLRMHPDELAIATWTHLGAEVVTLPWTEVYQGISKGIVGAVNSPVALVESMRFNEVADHIARTNEYYQSVGFMVNAQALADLSDDNRAALMRAYGEAGAMSETMMDDVTAASLMRMEEAGVKYVELDTKPFVERMKVFYDDLEAKGEIPEAFLAEVEATRP